MGLGTRLTDAGMRTMNAAHRALLALSRGRIGSTVGPMLVVELHTTGRSSGVRRSTLLTAPIHQEGKFVLVASKGGDDRNPEWYANLCANPAVELTVRGETRQYIARTASDREKAELWPRIVAAYPGYERYRRRTDRNIPVVLCEPADSRAAALP